MPFWLQIGHCFKGPRRRCGPIMTGALERCWQVLVACDGRGFAQQTTLVAVVILIRLVLLCLALPQFLQRIDAISILERPSKHPPLGPLPG